MSRTGPVSRYGTGVLPFAVYAQLDTYEGPGWVARQLRGRSGWLKVSRASMETPFSSWSTTLVAAVTDDGLRLNKMVAEAFFRMSCAGPLETNDMPPEELDDITEVLFDGFRGGCDIRHLRLLRESELELETRIQAEQTRGEHVLADADAFIAGMMRERRDPRTSNERRAQLDTAVELFETKQQEAAAWLIQRLRRLRSSNEQFESDVIESLENPGDIEELYSVRWVGRHRSDRVAEEQDVTHLKAQALRHGAPRRGLLTAEERWKMSRRKRLGTAAPQARGFPKSALVRKAIEDWTAKEQLRETEEKKRRDEFAIHLASNRPSRTEAQVKSAERRAEDRDLEELMAKFPTVELMAARLNEMLGEKDYDWRLAKLIRRAMRRLKRSSPANESDAVSTPDEVANA